MSAAFAIRRGSQASEESDAASPISRDQYCLRKDYELVDKYAASPNLFKNFPNLHTWCDAQSSIRIEEGPPLIFLQFIQRLPKTRKNAWIGAILK
jgi:hypothetical protein